MDSTAARVNLARPCVSERLTEPSAADDRLALTRAVVLRARITHPRSAHGLGSVGTATWLLILEERARVRVCPRIEYPPFARTERGEWDTRRLTAAFECHSVAATERRDAKAACATLAHRIRRLVTATGCDVIPEASIASSNTAASRGPARAGASSCGLIDARIGEILASFAVRIGVVRTRVEEGEPRHEQPPWHMLAHGISGCTQHATR